MSGDGHVGNSVSPCEVPRQAATLAEGCSAGHSQTDQTGGAQAAHRRPAGIGKDGAGAVRLGGTGARTGGGAEPEFRDPGAMGREAGSV